MLRRWKVQDVYMEGRRGHENQHEQATEVREVPARQSCRTAARTRVKGAPKVVVRRWYGRRQRTQSVAVQR